jgi:N-acetylneuraminic acid mutarotase
MNSRIYVLGGSGDSNGKPDPQSRITQIFDPNTGLWTPGTQMGINRVMGRAVSAQNQLFVVGGYNDAGPTTRSEVWNGQFWSSLPSMHFPRAGAAVAVVGNRIYVLSGDSNNAIVAEAGAAAPGGAFSNTGQYFDLSTGKWVLIENLAPTGFYGAAAAVLGGRIYMYGGLTRDPNFEFSSFVFDTETLSWGYFQGPALDRVWCGGASVGAKAYAFGGIRYRRLQPIGTINEYNPGPNSWSPLPQYATPGRALMATAVYGNSVFLFGGSTVFTNAPVFGTVEEFQPLDSIYYLLKKS